MPALLQPQPLPAMARRWTTSPFLPAHLCIPPIHHTVRVTALIIDVWSQGEKKKPSDKALHADTDM